MNGSGSDEGLNGITVSPIALVSKPPLVGRSELLARIQQELLSAQYSGVLLAGDPGSGKSRTLQEVAAVAQNAGLRAINVSLGSELGLLSALGGAMTTAGMAIPLEPSRLVAELSREHRKSPVVLCLDDANLLDKTSAGILLQLSHERACRLVVTVTNQQSLPSDVVSLWKNGSLCRLPITQLTETQMVNVCEAMLTQPIEFATAVRFSQIAQGNVVFMRELLASAIEEGGVIFQEGVWADQENTPTSSRMIELLSPLLGGLESNHRMALELLSLAEMMPLSAAYEILDPIVLEDLELQGLLKAHESEQGIEICVVNEMVRRSVIEKLSILRRRRLIRILINFAERHDGTLRGGDIQLALWRLEVGESISEEALYLAARQAWWALDWRTAQVLAEHAWHEHGQPRAGLFLLQLLAHQGRTELAPQMMDQIGAIGNKSEIRKAQSITYRRMLVHETPRTPSLISRGNSGGNPATGTSEDRPGKVGTGIHPADSSDLDRAMSLVQHGNCSEAWRLVRPMLDDGDPARVAMAGSVALTAALRRGRPIDGLELEPYLQWAMSNLSESEILDYDVLNVQVLTAYALGITGKAPIAIARLRMQISQASAVRNTAMVSRACVMLARLMFDRGKIPEAHKLFMCSGGQHDLDIVQQVARSGALLSATHLGDPIAISAATLRLEACLPKKVRRVEVEIAKAALEFSEGRGKEAAIILQDAAQIAAETEAFGEVADLIHALTRMGNSRIAATLCGDWTQNLQGTIDIIRVDFARSLASGDAKGVAICAEKFEEAGTNLFAAEAWAAASIIHREAGELRLATSTMWRCEAACREYDGAPTFLLWTLHEVEHLSPREREVAFLAARGNTSQEIADHLVVSVRTIDNHLYRVYRKLGVANRRELRQRLISNTSTIL